jgi:hypothetical protein
VARIRLLPAGGGVTTRLKVRGRRVLLACCSEMPAVAFAWVVVVSCLVAHGAGNVGLP